MLGREDYLGHRLYEVEVNDISELLEIVNSIYFVSNLSVNDHPQIQNLKVGSLTMEGDNKDVYMKVMQILPI